MFLLYVRVRGCSGAGGLPDTLEVSEAAFVRPLNQAFLWKVSRMSCQLRRQPWNRMPPSTNPNFGIVMHEFVLARKHQSAPVLRGRLWRWRDFKQRRRAAASAVFGHSIPPISSATRRILNAGTHRRTSHRSAFITVGCHAIHMNATSTAVLQQPEMLVNRH